jgi:uncharacterized protein (UPF0332 family)
VKGTPEQIMGGARDSLRAAEHLYKDGMHDVAASRAYFSMFYVASALLKKYGLDFDTHSGVHSAFGREFAKKDRLSREMQRWLLDAFVYKCAADYDLQYDMTSEIVSEMIRHAEEFVKVAEGKLGGE